MFENFTDQAGQVMAFANQEAQNFNHEYVGTEHVLLGLAKEGSIREILEIDSLTLTAIRLEVEKIVKPGPPMVVMGKLPQTPRTKNVINNAIEEAKNLNHKQIGVKHLIVGLLQEKDGVATQVLNNLGLKIEDLIVRTYAKVCGDKVLETSEFDKEFVADTFGEPNKKAKAKWEKAKKKLPPWQWKCFICGQEIEVTSGNDEKGLLPLVSEGGIVSIEFASGSSFDNLMLPGTWQSAIHDECFNKIKERARRVLIFSKKMFEQQENKK